MQRFKKVVVTATAVLAVGGGVAQAQAGTPQTAAAAAAATGLITNGTPYTDIPGRDRYCTIGAVGTDAAGNKVAISAAHCVSNLSPGAVLYRWLPNGGQGAAIGTIASQGWRGATTILDRDWVVIKLNDDAVLSSNGPGARITSVATAPVNTLSDIVCKDGRTTGVTCGAVITQNAAAIYNLAYVGDGDSGGPAFIRNTEWVGINYGYELPPGARYLRATKILADIEAGSSPVGKGFVITNTP